MQVRARIASPARSFAAWRSAASSNVEAHGGAHRVGRCRERSRQCGWCELTQNRCERWLQRMAVAASHDKSLVAVQDTWSPHRRRFVQTAVPAAPVPPPVWHVASVVRPVSHVKPGHIAKLSALLEHIQSERSSQPVKQDSRSVKAQMDVLRVAMALAEDSRFDDTPSDELMRRAAAALRLIRQENRRKHKNRPTRGQEASAVGDSRRGGVRRRAVGEAGGSELVPGVGRIGHGSGRGGRRSDKPQDQKHRHLVDGTSGCAHIKQHASVSLGTTAAAGRGRDEMGGFGAYDGRGISHVSRGRRAAAEGRERAGSASRRPTFVGACPSARMDDPVRAERAGPPHRLPPRPQRPAPSTRRSRSSDAAAQPHEP
jgi:hypothetical protein